MTARIACSGNRFLIRNSKLSPGVSISREAFAETISNDRSGIGIYRFRIRAFPQLVKEPGDFVPGLVASGESAPVFPHKTRQLVTFINGCSKVFACPTYPIR